MTAPRPEGSERPDPGVVPAQPPSAVWTGLACRCPRCGKGKLFSGVLRIAARCEICGLDLSKQDSGDGPAVFVIFFLGVIFIPPVIWLEFTFEPAWWLHVLIWPPLVVAAALALLRPMKGFLIAQQFRHKASDSGTVTYEEGDR